MTDPKPDSGPAALPGSPRVAIVHDWLVAQGGGERVLEEMLSLFPQADLYSTIDFLPPHQRGFLRGRTVHTSSAQSLPFARRHYRKYLPLLTLAIEQLDLSRYDLVISSSHTLAKGVLTGPDQLHVSYVHSPARYAWDLQHQYLREAKLLHGPKAWLARWLLHRFRIWDLRTVNGVDRFIANSRFIARRIMKVYRRNAAVIYPPVDTAAFTPGGTRGDFYLTVSRLVPYKRIDLMIDAFRHLPDRRLLVVGDGPDMAKLRERAKGLRNMELLGYQPQARVLELLRTARAFLFAAEEDFGISPVEAQACGTPVIAYGKGGALETVCGPGADEPTGRFFPEQSAGALVEAIRAFEAGPAVDPHACRANAERFSGEQFRRRFANYVETAWSAFLAESGRDYGDGL